jgi:hypothetical protein
VGGLVTIGEIRRGEVSLGDILKFNALMDAQEAAEAKAVEKAKNK